MFAGDLQMKGSYVHLGVRDLSGALRWLERVWQARPTFRNERMAVLPFGSLSLVFDAAEQDSSATIGFESENCDADYKTVVERGAMSLDVPSDRPWGVRTAYLKGPGALVFEIEQSLGDVQ
jgi:hypothetical protein